MKILNPADIRDLRPQVLGPDGRMQILPAAFWADTTHDERAMFGAQTGIYSLPTTELVERLREIIGGRSAIEIGAGNGVLAEALGIPGTDSYQQNQPKYRDYYDQIGVPTVPYGPNVVEMHASKAVRHYKPQVVLGCWVTHKYDPKEHARGGNEVGIDEADILRNCETYVFVGHTRVHQNSRLWDAPRYSMQAPSFLYSRALDGGGNDCLLIVER